MAGYDIISGGYDTTHVAAADRQRRNHRDAAALAYLRRRGLDDIAAILGLVPAPARPPRNVATDTKRALPARVCEFCHADYWPTFQQQRTCGKSCGSKLGAAEKRRTR